MINHIRLTTVITLAYYGCVCKTVSMTSRVCDLFFFGSSIFIFISKGLNRTQCQAHIYEGHVVKGVG